MFDLFKVFQIITGDAWNAVMVDAVKVTNIWASIYFITCLCFGSFVILNLFIAILLSKMSAEQEEKWVRGTNNTSVYILMKVYKFSESFRGAKS